MKVDLHVHTSERSACGRSSEAEQIRAAIASGLDGLVLTDHNVFPPAGTVERLNREHAPFKVFEGIEVDCEDEHVVVLGVRDPALEVKGWAWQDLRPFVNARGGFTILAHPFRYRDFIGGSMRELPPDAIEVGSKATPAEAEAKILEMARTWGVPVVCNSDAHGAEQFGQYHNRFDAPFSDMAELIALLKAGRFAAVARRPDGTERESTTERTV
jgi:predicted metal-dependent phosphoesterase TrpH